MGQDRTVADVNCRWCGEPDHGRGFYCPIVKAFEIDENDRVTRVEYLTPIDWPPERGEKVEPPREDYPRRPRSA